jgi:hypothetical protein
MSITHHATVAPIKIVLYIVFSLLTATLGYAAFQTSTEIRSKAAENNPDCKHGQVVRQQGQTCKIINVNRKGQVNRRCKPNFVCVDKKPAPAPQAPSPTLRVPREPLQEDM